LKPRWQSWVWLWQMLRGRGEVAGGLRTYEGGGPTRRLGKDIIEKLRQGTVVNRQTYQAT
jgi:hypothetical protein